jgi:hypothetical protein
VPEQITLPEPISPSCSATLELHASDEVLESSEVASENVTEKVLVPEEAQGKKHVSCQYTLIKSSTERLPEHIALTESKFPSYSAIPESLASEEVLGTSEPLQDKQGTSEVDPEIPGLSPGLEKAFSDSLVHNLVPSMSSLNAKDKPTSAEKLLKECSSGVNVLDRPEVGQEESDVSSGEEDKGLPPDVQLTTQLSFFSEGQVAEVQTDSLIFGVTELEAHSIENLVIPPSRKVSATASHVAHREIGAMFSSRDSEGTVSEYDASSYVSTTENQSDAADESSLLGEGYIPATTLLEEDEEESSELTTLPPLLEIKTQSAHDSSLLSPVTETARETDSESEFSRDTKEKRLELEADDDLTIPVLEKIRRMESYLKQELEAQKKLERNLQKIQKQIQQDDSWLHRVSDEVDAEIIGFVKGGEFEERGEEVGEVKEVLKMVRENDLRRSRSLVLLSEADTEGIPRPEAQEQEQVEEEEKEKEIEEEMVYQTLRMTLHRTRRRNSILQNITEDANAIVSKLIESPILEDEDPDRPTLEELVKKDTNVLSVTYPVTTSATEAIPGETASKVVVVSETPAYVPKTPVPQVRKHKANWVKELNMHGKQAQQLRLKISEKAKERGGEELTFKEKMLLYMGETKIREEPIQKKNPRSSFRYRQQSEQLQTQSADEKKEKENQRVSLHNNNQSK